ncbi:hypothetical protein EDB80DRAFT_89193 [Ilyonectria destructans]|nr:hypothetical protein EDB80DRAFT_89193 [Ilyonectria destructans]
MSTFKIATLVTLLAYAEARFGQEQIPVAAVAALGNAGFGDPGVAATIAGSIPGSLLAAASPCQKLTIADQIITELGTDQQVIDAAIGLVSAETNFNPFAVNVPFVCADATLPASAQLRGIVPLVDPAVTGSDVENANSATSVATPFNAAGLSQAEVMIAQGFSNFTAVAGNGDDVVLGGQDGAAAGGDAAAGNDAAATDGTQNNNAGNDAAATDGTQNNNAGNDAAATDGAQDNNAGTTVAVQQPTQCGGASNNTPTNNAGNDTAAGGNNNNNNDAANGGGAAVGTKNLDFGLCQPTMARVAGLNGRAATEFTFIPQDPLCAQGQQEALNPNIITNRICDQLINVCEASDEAIAACDDAQTQIEAIGTRDQSTADTWNALLGFAGADSTKATL